MKRCSTCNRTYTDPSLSFCIDDGTPLAPVASADASTVVSPTATQTGSDDDWNAVAYRPPASYVPPGTEIKRRRVWPWLLGIGGAFLLGIVAISVAALILAPKLLRPPAPVVTVETRNDNQPENSNVAKPADSNSNASNEANVDVETPPPTDQEQVLAQLRELENEWTVANLNADKNKLARILADDYVGPSNDGGLQSKAEYIQTIRRNTDIEKWEFDDLKLLLLGDRATLSGKITFVLRGDELEFDFKDKFVWRDARWQATGSEVTPRQ
jgi:uncharacterized protein DUF4440